MICDAFSRKSLETGQQSQSLFSVLWTTWQLRGWCHTFITEDSSPAEVALARSVTSETFVTTPMFTCTFCREKQRTTVDQEEPSYHLEDTVNVPWSQWTPYLPLWHVSQAVPLKPLLHWQTPVPLIPSKHNPLLKQGWALGPGHGSQCWPKNPLQHRWTWTQNGPVTKCLWVLGSDRSGDLQCSAGGRWLCSR